MSPAHAVEFGWNRANIPVPNVGVALFATLKNPLIEFKIGFAATRERSDPVVRVFDVSIKPVPVVSPLQLHVCVNPLLSSVPVERALVRVLKAVPVVAVEPSCLIVAQAAYELPPTKSPAVILLPFAFATARKSTVILVVGVIIARAMLPFTALNAASDGDINHICEPILEPAVILNQLNIGRTVEV